MTAKTKDFTHRKPGIDQPSESAQVQPLRWIAKTDPTIPILMEVSLIKANLLKPLEDRGVVPTVDNPNPHDPIAEASKHDRWWRQHPTERAAFCSAIETRQHALWCIYVGMQLTGMQIGKDV